MASLSNGKSTWPWIHAATHRAVCAARNSLHRGTDKPQGSTFCLPPSSSQTVRLIVDAPHMGQQQMLSFVPNACTAMRCPVDPSSARIAFRLQVPYAREVLILTDYFCGAGCSPWSITMNRSAH